VHLILDTGPWVALHCRSDIYHEWARSQFAQYPGPFLTCEAVVAETCFLLARAGFDPARALELIGRGVVRVSISLGDDVAAIRALLQRYDNVPASLADVCLIRLAELNEPSRVLTLDSDLHIYRRHGRKALSLITPAR
jgi:predicted nucleic acid-binding protein